MKLNLDSQPLGRDDLPVDLELDLGLEEEGGIVAAASLSGMLEVNNTQRHIVLSGTLQVRDRGVCDRCLEDFVVEHPVPVDITVVRDDPGEDDETEGAFDSWIIHQARGEVELDEPLREAVLLARPQKLLCREDCKGICPTCGCNRNVETCDCADETHDPRWEGLPG